MNAGNVLTTHKRQDEGDRGHDGIEHDQGLAGTPVAPVQCCCHRGEQVGDRHKDAGPEDGGDCLRVSVEKEMKVGGDPS